MTHLLPPLQSSGEGMTTGQLALDDAPVLARFMAKVRVNSETGCWDWTATTTRKNNASYGQIWLDGKHVAAHRFAYERFVGTIPTGLVIDHLCETALCVNPAHLRATTHRVNILRGTGATARNARKTHCVRGHPLYPCGENRRACRVYHRRSGSSLWTQVQGGGRR